jgi:hypothetical protein
MSCPLFSKEPINIGNTYPRGRRPVTIQSLPNRSPGRARMWPFADILSMLLGKDYISALLDEEIGNLTRNINFGRSRCAIFYQVPVT